MRFRITARLPAARPAAAAPPTTGRSATPAPSAAQTAQANRESVCRACPDLAGGLRCVKLCAVCPADTRRINPWERMPRCPAGRWP